MLLICADCATKYAVSLKFCPHCTSTYYFEDEEMPKISKHEGPTVEGHPDLGPEVTEVEGAAGGDVEDVGRSPEEPATRTVEGEPSDDLVAAGEPEGSPRPSPDQPEPEPEPDYEAMSVGDLRAELSSQGLATTGYKHELIERLRSARVQERS